MSAGALIIVRHGRTAFNAGGRLQGRTDNPLDEVGLEQATRVAAHVAPSLDETCVLISSPLLRARQTAEALAQAASLHVEVDERWIEIDYGVLEGTRQAEVPGHVWATWRSDPHFAPEAGESLHDVQQRVSQACEDLVTRLDGRTAVVVSHVSPIKSAIAWTLGVDVGVGWRTQLDTASVTRITLTDRGPVLRSFNESAP